WKEKLAVHRPSERGRPLGDPLLRHCLLPPPWHQPARLPARRAHPAARDDQPGRPERPFAVQVETEDPRNRSPGRTRNGIWIESVTVSCASPASPRHLTGRPLPAGNNLRKNCPEHTRLRTACEGGR